MIILILNEVKGDIQPDKVKVHFQGFLSPGHVGVCAT